MDEQSALDLSGFYAGKRDVLAKLYRQHAGTLERAVSRYCRGADLECIIHNVFVSLIEDEAIRRQFKGGNIGAWLSTIASHRAIDYLRRRQRITLYDDPISLEGALDPIDVESELLKADQMKTLERLLHDFFATTFTTPKSHDLANVFVLRFQEHLPQHEAAKRLGIPPTTLIRREAQIMKKLQLFLKRQLHTQ